MALATATQSLLCFRIYVNAHLCCCRAVPGHGPTVYPVFVLLLVWSCLATLRGGWQGPQVSLKLCAEVVEGSSILRFICFASAPPSSPTRDPGATLDFDIYLGGGPWSTVVCARQARSLPLRGGSGMLRFNDPSAGSPTETLLRLLLPLNASVWSSSRSPVSVSQQGHNPRTSLKRSIGSSDGRCVQRAGT